MPAIETDRTTPRDPAPLPWDIQPHEPQRWYSRFHDHFLLLGPERSLERAYQHWRQKTTKGGKGPAKRPPNQWGTVCRQQRWEERAAAWDERQRQLGRDSYAEEVRKSNERHKLMVRAAGNKLIGRLQLVSFDELTAPQVVSLMGQLIHLERLILGQPISVERVQHTGPDNGPVRSVQASAVSQTEGEDPAFLAVVMKILHDSGALPEEPPASDVPPARQRGEDTAHDSTP